MFSRTQSNNGIAKVHNERNTSTAVDFLNYKVPWFFDEHAMRVLRILTENEGRTPVQTVCDGRDLYQKYGCDGGAATEAP